MQDAWVTTAKKPRNSAETQLAFAQSASRLFLGNSSEVQDTWGLSKGQTEVCRKGHKTGKAKGTRISWLRGKSAGVQESCNNHLQIGKEILSGWRYGAVFMSWVELGFALQKKEFLLGLEKTPWYPGNWKCSFTEDLWTQGRWQSWDDSSVASPWNGVDN